MIIDDFCSLLDQLKVDCYAGVPDSQLQPLCDTLFTRYGTSSPHIVTANEGAAVAFAAGHYLATGNPALVYMQNSGIGNAINPICSLIHDKVYRIPVVFVVGWRGKPGVHDEPQHLFQGEITTQTLETLGISTHVITPETTADSLREDGDNFRHILSEGKSIAFVVEKNAFTGSDRPDFSTKYPLTREKTLEIIARNKKEGDIFVSTTGKMSRELFEIRERDNDSHQSDFLTVGSMGHTLMIACGIASSKPQRRVYCLDGDGGVLMHAGSMAVAGTQGYANLIHIVINNQAHESVGGMPTAGASIDFCAIATGCGYKEAISIEHESDLSQILDSLDNYATPLFIEIKTGISSRSDLGRPTTTPQENKRAFMEYLSGKSR